MNRAVTDRAVFAEKLTCLGIKTDWATVGYRDSFIQDGVPFAVDREKALRCRHLRANKRLLAFPRDLKRRKTAGREKKKGG